MLVSVHNNGEVSIYQLPDLVKKYTSKIFNDWSESISFSNDGKLLAVGFHGEGKLIVFNTDFNKFTIEKHSEYKTNSAISHIDWNENGTYIRINTVEYELL